LEDLVVDALDFITVKTDLADKYQNEITWYISQDEVTP
jgi:tRNA A37 threonylcarbamoyladenosine dehydratase